MNGIHTLFAALSPLFTLGQAERPPLPVWWWLTPVCSVAALVVAWAFYRSIIQRSEGQDAMREIAKAVREGAYAYLRRQYVVVALFFVVVAALLAWLAFGLGVQNQIVPFAFLTGGFFSALAGFFGMKTATSASARTAQGASESLNNGLTISFRGGAVMGLCVVGLALLCISLWFAYLYLVHHRVFGGGRPLALEEIAMVMLGMGLGASSMALFARVGGGIFTKAADVGADLVGKVEAGIPEDDPRNPATIADNVGDNVGDVAGMGADLFESYMGSILATGVLGTAAAVAAGLGGAEVFAYLAAPMLLAGVGIVLSIVGMMLVRTREDADMRQLMHALDRGIYAAAAMTLVAAAGLCWLLGLGWGVWGAIVVGVVIGIVIGKATEYYTAAEYGPTKLIAKAAESGHGPLIINGIAQGLLSAWVPILVIALGMAAAFGLSGGFREGGLLFGLYGVGIAAVGMLSTLGITLATDAYGPIADNAGGIAEMAGLGKQVRDRTDALDSLGNTTAAIGKGFAIGSAALTALALVAAYVEEVRVGLHREAAAAYAVTDATGAAGYEVASLGYGKYALYVPGGDDDPMRFTVSAFAGAGDEAVVIADPDSGEPVSIVVNQVGDGLAGMALTDAAGQSITGVAKAGLADYMARYNVTLMNPKTIIGVFMGVMLVFVFSALTMNAVGRSAGEMVEEVRRQFKQFPGIMDRTQKPDYARCVLISTRAAQKEMVLPSVLALAAPLAVGLVLGVAGVLGLLIGGLCCGFAMAVFMANSGGAWDNAKKLIETGAHGGKGSDAHKAAVVGDTVGDPFKDTSGPSLNILIKLMSMVSIVFAGLVVVYAPVVGQWLGIN